MSQPQSWDSGAFPRFLSSFTSPAHIPRHEQVFVTPPSGAALDLRVGWWWDNSQAGCAPSPRDPVAHLLRINLPTSLPTSFVVSWNHLANKLYDLKSWFKSVAESPTHNRGSRGAAGSPGQPREPCSKGASVSGALRPLLGQKQLRLFPGGRKGVGVSAIGLISGLDCAHTSSLLQKYTSDNPAGARADPWPSEKVQGSPPALSCSAPLAWVCPSRQPRELT